MVRRILPVVAAASLLLAGCASSPSSGSTASGGASSSSAASGGASSASGSSSSPASGNGLRNLSGTDALGKVKAAFSAAPTVHVVLNAKSDQGQAVGYDVRYAKGKGAIGSVNAGTGQIKLIAIGSDVYFTGDAKVLAAFGAAGAAGTWFKTSNASPVGKALAQLTDVNKLADQMFKPSGAIEVGDGKDVDGHHTVGLTDKGPEGGTLYVAAEGEPYPLLIEPPAAKKDQGDAKFSDYGAPVDLTAPAAFRTLPGS